MSYTEHLEEELKEIRTEFIRKRINFRSHIELLIKFFSDDYYRKDDYNRLNQADFIKMERINSNDLNKDFYVMEFKTSQNQLTFLVPTKYIEMGKEELNQLILECKAPSFPVFNEEGLELRNNTLLKYRDYGKSKEEVEKLYKDFFNKINGLDDWYNSRAMKETFLINFKNFVKNPNIFR